MRRARRGRRRERRRGSARALPVAQLRGQQLFHRGGLEVPEHREHHARRLEHLAVEPDAVGALDRLDRGVLRLARVRAAAAVDRLARHADQERDHIVVPGGDRAPQPHARELDLVLREGRLAQDLGEQPHDLVRVVAQAAEVRAREVRADVGADRGADRGQAVVEPVAGVPGRTAAPHDLAGHAPEPHPVVGNPARGGAHAGLAADDRQVVVLEQEDHQSVLELEAFGLDRLDVTERRGDELLGVEARVELGLRRPREHARQEARDRGAGHEGTRAVHVSALPGSRPGSSGSRSGRRCGCS